MTWLRSLTGVLAIVIAVSAQTPAAALGGLVTEDSKGLAGVTIRIHRAGGELAATATTDAAGRYQASGLPQGVYRVEFSADGFQTVVRPGVVLFSTQTTELNVSLRRIAGASTSSGASTPAGFSYADVGSALGSGEVGVRLETPLGFIFLAIDTAHAPVTSANFLKYVDAGYYDGGRFHRATRPDNYTPAPPDRPMMELIQGGINPAKRDNGFPPIPLERTSVTGLKHVRGTVSMARGTAANTATSDFFILLDDQPSLDFGGRRFDDGQGAAAFGRVVAGLDVVRTIQQQPVQGQSLTPPVAIVKAIKIQ